jgi:hypothetical protein
MRQRPARRKTAVQAGLALATWTIVRTATADLPVDSPARALALFDEAKVMMERGNFADACPKLAESQALDPQVGTVLNLAVCYENLGKTASACLAWRDASTAAAKKHQQDREEFAREHAKQLCLHVLRVTFSVTPQPVRERIELTINNIPLPREQWGLPTSLDPGEYDVRASAEGVLPWSSKFVVDQEHVLLVTVPVLALVTEASLLPRAAKTLHATVAPRREPRARWVTVAVWATGGAGVAAVGVGSAFGLAAMIHENASNQDRRCVSSACNAIGASERSRAMDDARIADVTLALGAGAVAIAAVMWAAGSRSPSRARDILVQPAVSQDGWSLAVGGAWQ